jgi:hypothetical protein
LDATSFLAAPNKNIKGDEDGQLSNVVLC